MGNVRTYSKKEAALYLTGMFGQNMIYNVVATGLYYYFQNVICLNAVALGWIFAIARVWDAINDPMMGAIVDKTHTKWGKCRPYLLFAPLVICMITCLAFLNGDYAAAKADGSSTKMFLITAWAAISYILWGMSYTVGDIPLWGIISRMSEDENDRAKLISLSRIIASIGAAGARERVPDSDEHKTMKESFALMWKCKPFRRILISGILRAPLQLMMTIIMTLFSYYYCSGDLTTAFTDMNKFIIVVFVGGGFFIGQFAAMVVCPMLMKKLDVKTIYNLTAFTSVPMVLLFVTYLIAPDRLGQLNWAAVDGFLLLLSGVGFGTVNVCQSVMISDCIDYEEYNSGYRPDGVFFSGQSFITKFSAGVSSLISGYVLGAVGYTDSNIDAMNKALKAGKVFAVDFPQYSKAMWFLITIPPAIGMIISIIPTVKYEITNKSHQKMLSELVERHTEMEKQLNDRKDA